MEIKLESITQNAEELIEFAGRNCYKSHDKITDKSNETFIKNLVKHHHFSVIEHGCASFYITGVSRACMAQFTRHRLASFSVSSQRYNKETEFKYVVPYDIIECTNESLEVAYDMHMLASQGLYNELLSNGIKPEDARMVLPQAALCDIFVTMNFRSWTHFLEERLSPRAQWEIRQVATKIQKLLNKECPNVFPIGEKSEI